MKLNKQEIFDKLKETVSAMDDKRDYKAVTLASNLRSDLELNSVGMLYFVIMLEEAFKIEFGSDDVNAFITVGDVVDYIWSKQA